MDRTKQLFITIEEKYVFVEFNCTVDIIVLHICTFLLSYQFNVLYIFSWLLVLIGVTLFLLRPARELREDEALCDCLPGCTKRLSAYHQQSSDSNDNPISNSPQTI